MADLERAIKILLLGEDVSLDKALTNASRDFDKLTANVQSATAPLANFGQKVALTEAALVAMVGTGIVYAYDKAKTLESAMIDLEKVVGDQPELLDMAKAAAYDLGDTYGESTAGIVQSIADFKQAGFTVEESIGLVKNSLDLMIAGEVEAAQSSQYLVQILKGFGEGADQAGRAVDILNAISNEYATDVEKLAAGLAEIAPVAATAGISMEQAAGLITPIIEVFQSGEEAARGLRTGLLRIADPTPEIKQALADLGVAVVDSNGVQRSAYDILLDVAGAYNGLTQEQKLTFASIVAGKDQAAKMVQVFDNLDGVLATTATAMNSAGSAMEEVEKRLASSDVAVNRFFATIENVFAKAGEKYIDSATGMINASTDIGKAIGNAIDDGTFDPILGAVDRFFADAKDKLSTIAKNLPEALEGLDFDGLIQSFRNLGEEVGDSLDAILGGEIDLSTVDGLTDALQRLINLFQGMTNFTAGFLDGLQPMLRVIGELGQSAGEAGEKGQFLSGQIMAWGQTAHTAAGALDTLKIVLFAVAGVTGLNQVAQMIALIGTRALVASTGIGAIGLALWGAFEVAEPLGGYLYRLFNDTGERAAESAERIAGVKDEIEQIQALTDEAIEFNIRMTDPEPVTKEEWQAIGEETRRMFEEAGLDTSVLNFDAVMEVKADTEPVYEAIEVAKIDAESKQIEIDATVEKAQIEKEIATIEADAKTIQTAMEWTAKLDIANAEAEAKKFAAVFETIPAALDSTGDTILGILDLMGDSKGNWIKLSEQLDAERKQRDEIFKLQQEALGLQNEMTRAKLEAMENGESLISIDASGLEPALEMIMWEIIKKVQIRANESAQEFLLGVS